MSKHSILAGFVLLSFSAFAQPGNGNGNGGGNNNDDTTLEDPTTCPLAPQVAFEATVGDKVSLYDCRFDETTMYGFGVAPTTLYSKTNGSYAWLRRTNFDASMTAQDVANASVMHLTGVGSRSSLKLIRQGDEVSYGSRLQLIDDLDASGSILDGAFMAYQGLEAGHGLQIGTYQDGSAILGLTVAHDNGYVGLGTSNPQSRLHITGPYFANASIRFGNSFGGNTDSWQVGLRNYVDEDDNFDADNEYLSFERNGSTKVAFHRNGGVGIGSTNFYTSTGIYYHLLVNGKVRAKEIVVESGWADYVFEDAYDLRPLSEVEAFIEENGHLPEIPSAAEVEQEGLSLGDMQTRMMMKIEELTLYLIDLKSENEALKADVERLKAEH